MTKIDHLTPEQKALIPVYRKRWEKLGLSTEPIDFQKARKAIEGAYKIDGMKKPPDEVIFFDSPFALFKEMERRLSGKAAIGGGLSLVHTLKLCIKDQLDGNVIWQLEKLGWSWPHIVWLPDCPSEILMNQLKRQFAKSIRREFLDIIRSWIIKTEELAVEAAFFDFCKSELGCHYPEAEWSVLLEWLENCGLLFPYFESDDSNGRYISSNIALMSDRPRILRIDDQNRPHAEGEAAIQFADGYDLYAYHGVILRKKYSKIHPSQWRSEWLLKERNLELRRVLIQGIGLDRLRKELTSEELDGVLRRTMN